MQKFLIKIFCLLLLPFVLFAGIIEWRIRQVPNDYRYKHEWMLKHAPSVQVLALGASTSLYGIIPKHFDKSAFNLAFVSQSLKYDDFLFFKYIDQCDSLEYLIWPISYFVVRSKGLEYGDTWWRVKSYCIYMDCDYHTINPKFCLEIFQKEKRQKFFDIIYGKENWMTCDSLGWSKRYSIEKERIIDPKAWEERGSYKAQYHSKNPDKIILDKNIAYITHVIKECEKRNIKVLLLTPPTHPTYYNYVNPSQAEEINFVCTSLCNKYNNVMFFDFFKDNRFEYIDFYDPDHLSNFGAEKFSILLNKYILEIDDSIDKTTHQDNQL